MKKTKNLMFAGAFALVAFALSSCGGSGSGSNAGSDIPTDGLLGELPALNAQWAAEAEKMLSDIEAEANDDKRTELNKEFQEWDKARKAKTDELRKALEGKEVPTEVAEGLPLKLDGNLKIVESPGQPGYRTLDKGVNVNIKGIVELTADLPNWTDAANFTCVAYDGDGNIIQLGKGYGLFEYAYDDSKSTRENDNMRGKLGAKYKVFVQVFCGNPNYARLAKIVIMDKTSDAYKQLEQQFNAKAE